VFRNLKIFSKILNFMKKIQKKAISKKVELDRENLSNNRVLFKAIQFMLDSPKFDIILNFYLEKSQNVSELTNY